MCRKGVPIPISNMSHNPSKMNYVEPLPEAEASATTTPGPTIISFEVVQGTQPLQLKVLGARSNQTMDNTGDPSPHFVKDEIVTLIVGPFPLTDYQDTYYYRKHPYVLRRPNGTEVHGFLNGFTYNCTPAGAGTGGAQEVDVRIE
jgi:hypothetical protein